jgi:hypothetical protein
MRIEEEQMGLKGTGWGKFYLAAMIWIATFLVVATGAGGGAAPIAEGERFFASHVQPILERRCLSCHSGDKPPGSLALSRRDAILKGGVSGPAVSLERPDESLLLAAINHQGRRMPPQGKLSREEIEALTRWVKLGLPWSAAEGPAAAGGRRHEPPPVNAETMRHWSFQPLQRSAPPGVRNRAWVRNAIDRFVLHSLEAARLDPSPRAPKAVLIRRAFYDLTGLPPSPEEVQQFIADDTPQAWPRLIERLLGSPQYGEKWGRHWLDLVRFAESNSYERDGTKPNAWRYRDYVVQSLNQDKPYDQFVLEQLAGDELTPRTPERIIATGYYRLGIWDDEPADREQALYDDLDDIASTTGQVFLGLTLGCARCHDHKLDPIPQKDYYRFLAFFSGVQRYGVRSAASTEESSQRPLVANAEQERQRVAIEAYRASVRANQEAIVSLERPILADLTPVENEEWRREGARIQIVKARVPRLLDQEAFDRYVALGEERSRLRGSAPPALDMALCVSEIGPRPRETFVMLRGNPHVRGEQVEPGFPSVLAPPAPEVAPPPFGDTSGRRLALARWIASPRNPLTARVMVNRVWQHHFGRGLVRTSSDFGFQGERSTHPELLDWLSREFVARGWRLKTLHRMIMLSATYQMSSRGHRAALAKDPRNDLFWRFDMRRLQAEEVRDSILAVSGRLNLKMGGPSFYPTLPAEVLAGQSRPGENWGRSTPEEQARRSVYIFVKRSLAVPILAGFDSPEPDLTCPVRFATTQPTQALGMLNSAFVNEQARAFAQSVRREAGDDPSAQVRLALWRVLQRPPSTTEIVRGVRHVQALQRVERLSAEDALSSFCLVALNLNEFVYLD